MLKILFIGDISGRIGREAVKRLLPKIKKQHKIDLVIANADNIAHGKGVNKASVEELMASGVDCFTGGDHSFDRSKSLEDVYPSELPVLRPANWSEAAPGRGWLVIEKKRFRVLVVNLIGRVFMKYDYDCPFREADKILANPRLLPENLSAIIIDMHAEASSEKVAMKYYLSGRASALLGTHTHIQTADEEITDGGLAYISDAGMTGFSDGSLGMEKENVIKTFLDQVKRERVVPEKGRAIFCAVMVAINEKTGKAASIKRLMEFTEIN